jgi:gamma-glutamyl-gamma-aminobutyrate hydrolase PuuD
MKKIIGVAPTAFIGSSNESYSMDYYKLGNNYIKRLVEAGCLPIGLAPADNLLSEEALAMCDGFLVQGGSAFYPYHFQIIHYAITHNKRFLGICLGQQLIYVYFKLKQIVEARGYEGDLVTAICDYISEQDSDFTVQKLVSGHRNEHPARGNEDLAKHDVNILPATLLHRVVDKDTIRICSFHSFATPSDQDLVTVNAWSALGDNVVEGTEYSDNILGIQGHPEADRLLPELFEFLAKD